MRRKLLLVWNIYWKQKYLGKQNITILCVHFQNIKGFHTKMLPLTVEQFSLKEFFSSSERLSNIFEIEIPVEGKSLGMKLEDILVYQIYVWKLTYPIRVWK